MYIFIQWIATVLTIVLAAYILPGVLVTDWPTAILAGLILSLINLALRPILLLLTLPINLLTLGLFTFVINALLILLTDALVPGFEVDNFWWAILFSIILSIITAVFSDLGKPRA